MTPLRALDNTENLYIALPLEIARVSRADFLQKCTFYPWLAILQVPPIQFPFWHVRHVLTRCQF